MINKVPWSTDLSRPQDTNVWETKKTTIKGIADIEKVPPRDAGVLKYCQYQILHDNPELRSIIPRSNWQQDHTPLSGADVSVLAEHDLIKQIDTHRGATVWITPLETLVGISLIDRQPLDDTGWSPWR